RQGSSAVQTAPANPTPLRRPRSPSQCRSAAAFQFPLDRQNGSQHQESPYRRPARCCRRRAQKMALAARAQNAPPPAARGHLVLQPAIAQGHRRQGSSSAPAVHRHESSRTQTSRSSTKATATEVKDSQTFVTAVTSRGVPHPSSAWVGSCHKPHRSPPAKRTCHSEPSARNPRISLSDKTRGAPSVALGTCPEQSRRTDG